MSTYRCKFFSYKEDLPFFWTMPGENCGLCKEWVKDRCFYHEELKETGENDLEEYVDDYGFSRVNTEWDEGGGYGK